MEFADATPLLHPHVLGDVLDDGYLHFVEAAETLETAKRRIKALAESLPGVYVIYDEQTGERVSISAGGGEKEVSALTFSGGTQR